MTRTYLPVKQNLIYAIYFAYLNKIIWWVNVVIITSRPLSVANMSCFFCFFFVFFFCFLFFAAFSIFCNYICVFFFNLPVKRQVLAFEKLDHLLISYKKVETHFKSKITYFIVLLSMQSFGSSNLKQTKLLEKKKKKKNNKK